MVNSDVNLFYKCPYLDSSHSIFHVGYLLVNVNGYLKRRIFFRCRQFVVGSGFRGSRYFSPCDDTVTTIVTHNVPYLQQNDDSNGSDD